MTLVNNRMYRTGWNELFASSDRAILVKLSRTTSRTMNGDLLIGKYEGRELRSPAANEMSLRYIAVGIHIALERCRNTVRYTDISIRC
jgi:ABC-type tungstate transport system permease subunit